MNKMVITSLMGLVFSAPVLAAETPATYTANDDLLNVHNRCIVRLHNDIDSSQVKGIARAMAARGNTTLKHVYQHSIKGFAVNMPCSAANAAFGGDTAIASMSADGVVSINKGKPPKKGGGTDTLAGQLIPYGTGRVGGPFYGGGTAWIIDTGIDLDHPDLNVDASRGASFVKGNMDDQNGHGTHVAGTIGALDNGIGSLGVAPNTTVIPVRVLDRRGSGSISGVIAGVDHVGKYASPGDCVNLSLGGGANQILDDAVVAAAADPKVDGSGGSGAYFVLAAGNNGDDANNHSPARVNGPNVWTISAVDVDDNMPSWSNYGNPPVDFAAPGVSIFSLWKGGGTNTISGTSMAAPHACAVLMMTNGVPASDGSAGNDPDGNPDPIIHL